MLEEDCNLSLAIGGCGDFIPSNKSHDQKRKTAPVQFHTLFPARPKEEAIKEETSSAEEKNSEILRLTNNKEEDGGASTRKKLRLSKEQLALLEDSFTSHSTLAPDQKQDLANRLSLQPRQVEVWFQNRRARTKLKQTEVDCEFLKKCWERLTNENRRLKRELMELRSAKPGSQYCVELRKAARLRMCSACEKMVSDEKKRGGL